LIHIVNQCGLIWEELFLNGVVDGEKESPNATSAMNLELSAMALGSISTAQI